MNESGIEQQIASIVTDLTAEFASSHTAEHVAEVVSRWRQDIEPSAKIKDFIAVLVRRFAREEMAASIKPARIAV